ncbi:MAG: succinate:quinone oxidoreductase, partial [Verrucomicrobiota bacterium]
TAANRGARKESYARPKTIQATLASRTMILSGMVVMAFAIFHILHFTVQSTHPEFKDMTTMLHGKEVHDVYSMVVAGFRNELVSGFYILAVVLLGFHLSHGFSSLFQTLGLRSGRTLLALRGTGLLFTAIIVLGNISIPISILAGLGPFAKS